MRVFMLGWEFPPFISGGLGTACYGLTKAMSSLGTDIMFVLPRPVSTPFSTHLRIVSPRPESPLAAPSTEYRLDEFEHVTFKTVHPQTPGYELSSVYDRPADAQQRAEATLKLFREAGAPGPSTSVQTVAEVQRRVVATKVATGTVADIDAKSSGAASTAAPAGIKPAAGSHYGHDLFGEVQRYASLASEIARGEQFDVVHAHDWMTFPAGLAVAAVSGKPLVVHVHSTEFDRAGMGVDSRIYDIERRGMHGAMKVICVSHLTRNQCIHHYGVDASKIDVVYNAVETNGNSFDPEKYAIHRDEKLVLFLGRITMQKGPEYFLAAAKKVIEVMDNVKFVMAGSGDMIRRVIEMAGAMGIGDKVLFTGFLRGGDVDKVFKMADLYVMPSVSEPFGIAPLEAMSHDVPVIISKQSGVSEVLTHALKVDFWDIEEMANKIIAVLRHPPLASTLRQHGSFEVNKMSWLDSASSCIEVYNQAVKAVNGR
jgi:glycosyltransferase involved in cell wall biosynthesis